MMVQMDRQTDRQTDRLADKAFAFVIPRFAKYITYSKNRPTENNNQTDVTFEKIQDPSEPLSY